MDLKIVTFNCNSIRKNCFIVEDLLSNCDILLLQETMIPSDMIDSISNINLDFQSCHIPSYDPNINGHEGRLRGGLSIFWNKKFDKYVEPIVFSNVILGLRLKFNQFKYLILNVYMPFDDRKITSLFEHRNIYAQLSLIKDQELIDKLLIIGDFNADPNKGKFWSELVEFTRNSELKIVDHIELPYDSFTYISPAHSSTSWLDHILSSDAGAINQLHILYGVSLFDHIPIEFNFRIAGEAIRINEKALNINPSDFILWNKLSHLDREAYQNEIDHNTNDYENEGLYCRVTGCNSKDHRLLLNEAYTFLVNKMKAISSKFSVGKNKVIFKIIPGWNRSCKSKYKLAKQLFIVWKNKGRLRVGNDYERMKSSRNDFKKALDKCKKDEEIIRKEQLCDSFSKRNKKEFWKQVHKYKIQSHCKISKMDGLNNYQ